MLYALSLQMFPHFFPWLSQLVCFFTDATGINILNSVCKKWSYLLFFQIKLNLDQALHLPDLLGSGSLSRSVSLFQNSQQPLTQLREPAFWSLLGMLLTLVGLVTSTDRGPETHFQASSSSSLSSFWSHSQDAGTFYQKWFGHFPPMDPEPLLAFSSLISIPAKNQRGFLLETYP